MEGAPVRNRTKPLEKATGHSGAPFQTVDANSRSLPTNLNSEKSQELLSLSNFSVGFPDKRNGFSQVVSDLNIQIGPGETVGIVGESGCGKSVTWLAALGMLGNRISVSGSVQVHGDEILGKSDRELSRIRGGKVAMIFQDSTSSLNPVQTIGRQIGEALALHRGLSGKKIEIEARQLLDKVGIGGAAQRLKQYPHEISGGMNQRVMIAMALAGQPDLLIADEPTTALDVTIQAQILELLRSIQAETGMALVLISHDLGVVSDLCERICVMYAGRIVEQAPSDALFEVPYHPYTQGLLAALPRMTGAVQRLKPIPGRVPRSGEDIEGCSFAPRCAFASDVCRKAPPGLKRLGNDNPHRRVACLHVPATSVEALQGGGGET